MERFRCSSMMNWQIGIIMGFPVSLSYNTQAGREAEGLGYADGIILC